MTRSVDESGKQRKCESISIIPVSRLVTSQVATADKTSLRPDMLLVARHAKEKKKELIDDIDKIFGF